MPRRGWIARLAPRRAHTIGLLHAHDLHYPEDISTRKAREARQWVEALLHPANVITGKAVPLTVIVATEPGSLVNI